jgi:hypothetical protein
MAVDSSNPEIAPGAVASQKADWVERPARFITEAWDGAEEFKLRLHPSIRARIDCFDELDWLEQF